MLEIHKDPKKMTNDIRNTILNSSVNKLFRGNEKKNNKLGNLVFVPRKNCNPKGTFEHVKKHYRKCKFGYILIDEILTYSKFEEVELESRHRSFIQIIENILK